MVCIVRRNIEKPLWIQVRIQGYSKRLSEKIYRAVRAPTERQRVGFFLRRQRKFNPFTSARRSTIDCWASRLWSPWTLRYRIRRTYSDTTCGQLASPVPKTWMPPSQPSSLVCHRKTIALTLATVLEKKIYYGSVHPIERILTTICIALNDRTATARSEYKHQSCVASLNKLLLRACRADEYQGICHGATDTD